jgi:hypothetical protein
MPTLAIVPRWNNKKFPCPRFAISTDAKGRKEEKMEKIYNKIDSFLQERELLKKDYFERLKVLEKEENLFFSQVGVIRLGENSFVPYGGRVESFFIFQTTAGGLEDNFWVGSPIQGRVYLAERCWNNALLGVSGQFFWPEKFKTSVSTLEWKQVDLAGGWVFLVNKGNRARRLGLEDFGRKILPKLKAAGFHNPRLKNIFIGCVPAPR